MTRISFIKSVYWIAAAVDAAVETRYALGTGAALMSGWTALLIWASVEPVARRGVLLLTAVPVIAGLALSTLYGHVHGYIPRGGALSVWTLQGILVILLAIAYRLAVFSARAPRLSRPAVLNPASPSPGEASAGT